MKIRPSATAIRSLIGIAVLGSLAAACTTATPRLVSQSAFIDQSAAIVRAAALAVDKADSVAALPRGVLAGRIDFSASDSAREFMNGERTLFR